MCRYNGVKGAHFIGEKMERPAVTPGPVPPGFTLDREFTLSQIKWKRSLTDIDMKRRLAEKKERSNLRFEIIKKAANPTLRYELENFKLFGNLQKSQTYVHDTLPSTETIQAEQKYIEFEKHRKTGPHDVKYNEFYLTMAPHHERSPCLTPGEENR